MPLSVPILRSLAAVVLALALLGLRPAVVAEAIPIEGYPTYQPQTTCSPSAKRGTVMLASWLQRRYPGSGSSGISRSCTASGTSEHKEGRAFDWRLDARSARDRRYAQSFLGLIRATDRRGNRRALARRMGIMYVIWSDHIWSASDDYRKRTYKHAACKILDGCSTTLRHRDHMHISLTRAAARGLTSWYVARSTPKPTTKPTPRPTAKPAPKPAAKPTRAPKPTPKPAPRPASRPQAPKPPDGVIDLRRRAYVRVQVPVDGQVVETAFKLAGGQAYSLTAAGLYGFGGPTEVGDAVCTWDARDQEWRATPRAATRRSHGRPALLVDGRRVFGDSCRESHTYRTEFGVARDRTLTLRFAGDLPRARGRITVVVGRPRANVSAALPAFPELTPAPTYSTNPQSGYGLLSETVRVPASQATASYTRGSLEPGATYRVTLSGVVSLGRRVRSDGRCVWVRGQWYDAASIDPRVPGQDHGNLYLDGRPFGGEQPSGTCSGGPHVTEVTATERGRLRLDLWDPLLRGDNTGELSVLVQRVTPLSVPVAAPSESPRRREDAWSQRHDELTVPTDRALGRLTTMRLRRGDVVRLTVRGRYASGGTAADASCVRTTVGWQPRDPSVLGQDALNLWVDGRPVAWRTTGGGCSDQATYTTRFTATKHGPLRLAVLDLDHRDNTGTLAVTLRRLG